MSPRPASRRTDARSPMSWQRPAIRPRPRPRASGWCRPMPAAAPTPSPSARTATTIRAGRPTAARSPIWASRTVRARRRSGSRRPRSEPSGRSESSLATSPSSAGRRTARASPPWCARRGRPTPIAAPSRSNAIRARNACSWSTSRGVQPPRSRRPPTSCSTPTGRPTASAWSCATARGPGSTSSGIGRHSRCSTPTATWRPPNRRV